MFSVCSHPGGTTSPCHIYFHWSHVLTYPSDWPQVSAGGTPVPGRGAPWVTPCPEQDWVPLSKTEWGTHPYQDWMGYPQDRFSRTSYGTDGMPFVVSHKRIVHIVSLNIKPPERKGILLPLLVCFYFVLVGGSSDLPIWLTAGFWSPFGRWSGEHTYTVIPIHLPYRVTCSVVVAFPCGNCTAPIWLLYSFYVAPVQVGGDILVYLQYSSCVQLPCASHTGWWGHYHVATVQLPCDSNTASMWLSTASVWLPHNSHTRWWGYSHMATLKLLCGLNTAHLWPPYRVMVAFPCGSCMSHLSETVAPWYFYWLIRLSSVVESGGLNIL